MSYTLEHTPAPELAAYRPTAESNITASITLLGQTLQNSIILNQALLKSEQDNAFVLSEQIFRLDNVSLIFFHLYPEFLLPFPSQLLERRKCCLTQQYIYSTCAEVPSQLPPDSPKDPSQLRLQAGHGSICSSFFVTPSPTSSITPRNPL